MKPWIAEVVSWLVAAALVAFVIAIVLAAFVVFQRWP